MMYPLTQAFITRGCGHLYRSLRLPSHVVRHLVRHRDAWVVPWFDPRAQRCSCWPWHSCGSATQVERSGSTCCAKLKGVTTNTTRDLHRLGSITLLQATATYRCIREHSILRSRRRTQGYSQYDSSAERLWCGQQVSDDHDTGCGARTHSSRSARGSPQHDQTASATFPRRWWLMNLCLCSPRSPFSESSSHRKHMLLKIWILYYNYDYSLSTIIMIIDNYL